MFGNPICARTEPSTSSTKACTTDCGCTTTSTASYPTLNRKCASITSRALFASVAESTVIFFPIRHVVCRSASVTVAWATRSGVQVLNGPPDAVRMRRASSAGRRPLRHCSTALCSESIGTISPPPSRAARHELARPHQRLLVRERDALPGAQRGQRGLETRRTHDRVDDDLDVGAQSRFHQAFASVASSSGPLPRIDQPDVAGPPVRRLPLEQLGVGVGGEGCDAKPLPLPGEHPQRGAADRAGRAEDRDSDGHATPNSRNRPAVTGSTKYSESSRSSTPPWPGISEDESLTAASRLKRDSATSPTWAASATTTPTVASCTTSSRTANRSSSRGP